MGQGPFSIPSPARSPVPEPSSPDLRFFLEPPDQQSARILGFLPALGLLTLSLHGPHDGFQTGRDRRKTKGLCPQLPHVYEREGKQPTSSPETWVGPRGAGHRAASGHGEKASGIVPLMDLVQKMYSPSPTVLKVRRVLPLIIPHVAGAGVPSPLTLWGPAHCKRSSEKLWPPCVAPLSWCPVPPGPGRAAVVAETGTR